MAEADTLTTLTPKQLGRHLREVRRRKGLSLSEVARGAGLTRRELNAYEKGRAPVPENDLFVIAGSCGVDVSELRPPTPVPELQVASAGNEPAPAPATVPPVPSSIEDTVAQLRRSQEVATPSVPTTSGRRRPRAIGAATDPAPAAPAPDWPVEGVDPLEMPPWPADAPIAAAPPAAADPSPAEPIDVFEELARLPEPLPLPADDQSADDFFVLDTDLTAPPIGAVEQIDTEPFDAEAAGEWPANAWPANESDQDDVRAYDVFDAYDEEPVLVETPNTLEAPPEPASAADAPPIDVAARVESFTSPWDSLRGTNGLDTPVDHEWPGGAPVDDAPPVERWSDAETTSEDQGPWSPAPTGWAAPWTEDTDTEPASGGDSAGFGVQEPDDWASNTPAAHGPPEPVDLDDWRDSRPATVDEVAGPWAHEPDPEATSTGFYIDWGESADDALPAIAPEAGSWDLPTRAQADDTLDTDDSADTVADEWTTTEPEPVAETWTATTEREPVTEPAAAEWPFLGGADAEPEPVAAVDDEPPLISWRPAFDDGPMTATSTTTSTDPAPGAGETPMPEPDEQFVVAGAEWQLGNAVPLVEVRGTGSLVMRRADERWALADVTATPDFAVEVYVDLRSGPGFGVLFRANVDAEGRMSGYSFDVDPVYEGGGYLVREWRADRELWNPIAHVRAPDPDTLHGLLAVRLTVDDDRLVASVNGETVLTVESLKQASADRDREGASGNRVGIQAWSSTDLVIDELRVARR